jgi:hypothetical protein
MMHHAHRWQFRSIGVRLGVGFGVVLTLMLLMLVVAGIQLRRIQLHNADSDRHTARLVQVQEWSTLVRTNLDRALTATRLDAAIGDDEGARARLGGVLSSMRRWRTLPTPPLTCRRRCQKLPMRRRSLR